MTNVNPEWIREKGEGRGEEGKGKGGLSLVGKNPAADPVVAPRGLERSGWSRSGAAHQRDVYN